MAKINFTGYYAHFKDKWTYYWLAETDEGIAFFPTNPPSHGLEPPFFQTPAGTLKMVTDGTLVLVDTKNHLDYLRDKNERS